MSFRNEGRALPSGRCRLMLELPCSEEELERYLAPAPGVPVLWRVETSRGEILFEVHGVALETYEAAPDADRVERCSFCGAWFNPGVAGLKSCHRCRLP